MKSLVLLICVLSIVNTVSFGQSTARQELVYVLSLQKQGRFKEVTAIVPQLLQSDAFNTLEKGQMWTLLGFAYEVDGNYRSAQNAYDNALRALSDDERYARDFAIALQNFSTLYQQMARGEDAIRLETKALTIFQKLGDARGIAQSCASLATLELGRKRLKKSQQYLTMSRKYALQTDDLGDSYFASLSSTAAWYAELTGDMSTAISEYRHSLDLFRSTYGTEHMITGWSYILLANAYSRAGDQQTSLAAMRTGLGILARTLGPHNPKYLVAEIAYSRVLKKAGDLEQAKEIRRDSEQELALFTHGADSPIARLLSIIRYGTWEQAPSPSP